MSLFRWRSETGSPTDRRRAVSDAAKWKEGQRESFWKNQINTSDRSPLRGGFCSIRLFVCFVLICQVCVSGTFNEALNIQSLLFIPDMVIKDATQLTRLCLRTATPRGKDFQQIAAVALRAPLAQRSESSIILQNVNSDQSTVCHVPWRNFTNTTTWTKKKSKISCLISAALKKSL